MRYLEGRRESTKKKPELSLERVIQIDMIGSKKTDGIKVIELLNSWERYSPKVTFRSNRVIVKSKLMSESNTNKISLPVSQRIIQGVFWEPVPLLEGMVPVHDDVIEEKEVEISNSNSTDSSEDDHSSRSSIPSSDYSGSTKTQIKEREGEKSLKVASRELRKLTMTEE